MQFFTSDSFLVFSYLSYPLISGGLFYHDPDRADLILIRSRIHDILIED